MSDRPDRPSWSTIAGPPFVGFILNWGLLGVLLVQVYIYHIFFPKDSRWFKCLVYGIFTLDCVQTLLVTVDMFDNFIYRWGSPTSFSTIGNGWFSFIILGGVISAIVQWSFSWRLWILARSMILTGAVSILALVQLCGSIVGGTQLYFASGAMIQKHSNVALTIWLLGSAVVDVVIAIAMTILLLRTKQNNGTGNGRSLSSALVNRLIFFVIETGTMTATVAIISIVIFLASPGTYLHECPVLILAKLYSNSLLAGFNNRVVIERVECSRARMHIQTTVYHSSLDPEESIPSVRDLESGLATIGSVRESMGTLCTMDSPSNSKVAS